ncbi:MAG: RNA polymerase-associated protein RapA [Methyloglobulus sp.]|nr:RNA polymerase-associated protein RapA [Methyloglobulus sp.]
MNNFIPGQRWISSNESELGLGLVLEVAYKRVTVLFLASNEKRIYASDNAPLTRVMFAIGDIIESVDEEKITVVNIIEEEGLLTYVGKDESGVEIHLEEIELNHNIQFNKPQDRLFTGQIDPNAWFLLRYQTWQHQKQHQQSPVKGLFGGRTSLIQHQLYIAHEAANRSAPRIMLADEVGLGKTIEAGLILHQRLINGLSKRILIIVPESLLHQWLVEMLRRFNLRFSIFDEVRCLEESGDSGFDAEDDDNAFLHNNPFANEQCILCSQQFFSRHPSRQKQALAIDWDMVIVDEAHHLEWSEQAASPEYQFVEQLGLLSPSLILLTATPEQLGQESHFARLRLLDADRFFSFSAFVEEEKQFEPVAEAAKLLLSDQPLNTDVQQQLAKLLEEDNVGTLLKNLNDPEESASARDALLKILVDHHGTGRILFRNSRQTVRGFPERERHAYALPGQANPDDWENDPRYVWLVATVRQLTGQKALLICKHAHTAIALEQTLKNRAGIAAAVFHEGMTIIERDRAAAYFADRDSPARLLICSEIGSEGRNFQFAHHLILFDLPTNPDLLQQRIGRLDRIGQKQTIQIHVPYIEQSEEAILYQWYDEGLDAFRSNSSAASRVADILHDDLLAVLQHQNPEHTADLISKTKKLNSEIETQLQHGRDLLLELNSCRKDIAMDLIDHVNILEKQGSLWPYLEDLFECYGVETEFHSPDCFIIKPGDHMRVSHFPGLQEDGITVTVNRQIALAREDMQFYTWEHPTVSAAMDLVLSSETGNAAISIVRHNALKAGQFLLECLFIVECSAPLELQVNRFLPATPVRILIDQHLKDQTQAIDHRSLVENRSSFDLQQIVGFVNNQRQHITKMLNLAEQSAKNDLQNLINEATKTMLESQTTEIKRLVRLKKINPSIKADEIDYLKDMTLLAHESIQAAQIRLDAVRFIVTS